MSTEAMAGSVHPAQVAPGPVGSWILGNVPALQRDPIAFLLFLARTYGDVSRIRLGPRPALVIHHPDHIKYVVADRAANFSKPGRFIKALAPVLGNGLLLSYGDFWKRQRRIA